jgi:hypothetical protein
LNTVARFFNNIAVGKLASGASLPVGKLPCEFIENALNDNYMTNPPPLPSDPGKRPFRSRRPSLRIFDALGSTTNSKNFVFLESGLNNLKNRVSS